MYNLSIKGKGWGREMKESVLKTTKGIRYFYLALYAFAGLGIEIIYSSLLEPMVYGASMQEWTISENIIHWSITCVTWGIVAYNLIKLSEKKYGFNLFEPNKRMQVWQWIGVFICIILSLYISFNEWAGFKPFIEYQHQGILKFIFQYIYYLFETLLFMLILIFGQKACEVWFGKENIPYGGIVVAVTWGLIHILTKGSVMTGILSALAGFFYGTVYLLLNRDLKKTFLVLFIMFVM